jgi:hypothetical protein
VWRTREVIEVPVVPRVVTQHVYIERACPMCSKRVKPKPELEGVVVGKSRLGVGLVSLIATLKEKLRLPIEQIQWYLQTFHKLHVSRGEIDYSLKRVVQVGHKQAEEVLNRVRASPVVNADETGWRESGSNGYVWTLSTPTERYFVRGNRSAQVLKALLGDFGGVLVSDFYAGYDCYEGYHQRCWVHLLRDLHELAHVHPQDEVKEWTNSVTKLYRKAKLYTGLGSSKRKEEARLYFERQLRQLYEPYLNNKGSPMHTLSKRMERYEGELFVFVSHKEVPSDNNAAERALRHLVTTRKISGGTRSEAGTLTKMKLSTLFGTWLAQGLNPYHACIHLLSSPQL